jgi:TctA family transporter
MRLSMIGFGGDMKVFWSNGLVGSITTLAIVLLFWPRIDRAFSGVRRLMRPAKATGSLWRERGVERRSPRRRNALMA